MNIEELIELFNTFKAEYENAGRDEIWAEQSNQFREFWYKTILGKGKSDIPDEVCDPIIRILDRNGKGNTKDSQAVAKAMIPQGAWRRMFNEFHRNSKLSKIMTRMMEESDSAKRAEIIDDLYEFNQGQKNNLTGPSGNAVGAFLAAFNPFENLSIISLKDRLSLMQYLGLDTQIDWDNTSIGERIAITNGIILEKFRALGFSGSARLLSTFCYSASVKPLWKNAGTVNKVDKRVSVTVPESANEEEESGPPDTLRESFKIQALICKIGTLMGFTIWLPRADRKRVQEAWAPKPGELLEELPLGYDSVTMKTIEQIDVIWLRKRSIVRAFEVEHTTSVYSGLLRMADLIALQPNINIKLHIVAPIERLDKVLQEIKRPVFSLLEGRELAEMCSFLSYDNIYEIGEMENLLHHLSDSILEDFEERAS